MEYYSNLVDTVLLSGIPDSALLGLTKYLALFAHFEDHPTPEIVHKFIPKKQRTAIELWANSHRTSLELMANVMRTQVDSIKKKRQREKFRYEENQGKLQVSASRPASVQSNGLPPRIELNRIELNKKKILKEKEFFNLEKFPGVKISEEELGKLKAQFADWEDRLERLWLYIGSKGDKYKSHYLTILNWAKKSGITPAQEKTGMTTAERVAYEQKVLDALAGDA